MLPSLLLLLSKLEIAIPVDSKLLLAPSLLPESIDYPPPVYVGLSDKAFLIDKDVYNTTESPGDWLKSLSEDSMRSSLEDSRKLSVYGISGKKISTDSVFTHEQLPTHDSSSSHNTHNFGDAPSSKPDEYLDIENLNLDDMPTDNFAASAEHDFHSSQSNPVVLTTDYPQYPLFQSLKNFSSTSSSYHPLMQPLHQNIDDIEINIAYYPTLYRIWLAHFIPEGFWPRLLCRITSDVEIDATFTKLFPSTLKVDESHSLNRTDIEGCFLWNLWKTGVVFMHEGVTLLELKQCINGPVNYDLVANSYLFSEKYRIEVIVHISSLALVHNYDCQQLSLSSKDIVKLGTKLLVLIEQHIINVGDEWYLNTLSKTRDGNVSSYVVCSECMADKPIINCPSYTCSYYFSLDDDNASICFAFEDVLDSLIKSKPLNCPYHQAIPIQLIAPDLVSY